MVLQSCSGAVRLPAVLTLHQELLQLRLGLAALFHVVHVAHDAGKAAGASLINQARETPTSTQTTN